MTRPRHMLTERFRVDRPVTRGLAVVLVALTAAAPLARAADQAAPQAAPSPAQSAANEDFGRLSKQGGVGYRDVRLARLAIFDGQPAQAKQYAAEAKTALDKARNDAAAYTKAESDLTPPAGTTQPKGGAVDAGPVRWLPVDGAMTVDEDFTAVPAKKQGVAKADRQIRSGDTRGAMRTLKLAGVDVVFDVEVIPLDQSIKRIDDAVSLVNSGEYYEANQLLKSIEDSARFDVESFGGAPQKTAAAAPPSQPATPGQTDAAQAH